MLEEGQEQGPRGNRIFATLAGIANDQQSHSGSARGSRNTREHIENGAAESAEPKRGADKELAKAETTFGPFLPSGGKQA